MKMKLLQKSSINEKKHLPFPVYLSYLLLIAFMLTSVTSARFLSSMSGSDHADVAKWSVDVEFDNDSKVTMSRPDDNGKDIKTYSFSVNNYKNGTVSEVALQYDIIITLNDALPDGVTVNLDNKPLWFNNNKCIISNAGIFSASQQCSQQHELSFIGDYSVIEESYSGSINIQVNAQQID